MRGYGATDAPQDVAQYTVLHLVGDMVELVRALGEKQAVIVGHDWGAPVAWACALLRPDIFRAVAGMSVPFVPPGRIDLLQTLKEQGIDAEAYLWVGLFTTAGLPDATMTQLRDLVRKGESTVGIGTVPLEPKEYENYLRGSLDLPGAKIELQLNLSKQKFANY
jgi:pimeloyl-ACP methyl ester carboxylesterase